MFGNLISMFFNFLLTVIMSIVQLICLPLNMLFNGLFPDFSSHLSNIDSALDTAYSGLSWAISFVPPLTKDVMLLIFTIELSMLVVMRSTHMTAKVWKILQKLKFW